MTIEYDVIINYQHVGWITISAGSEEEIDNIAKRLYNRGVILLKNKG